MARQTLAYLKGSNRNFDNILDSYLNTTDGGQVNGMVHKSTLDLGGSLPACLQTDATACTGTAGETNIYTFPCGNILAGVPVGTQTLIYPVVNTGGLIISGDETNDDGWEYRTKSSLNFGTLNKNYFTTKTSPAFFFKAKFSIADVTGYDIINFGFTKDQAYGATYTDYDDYAYLQVLAGDIKTETSLADGTAVTTDLGHTDWADTETHTLEVRVDKNGAATYYVDGVTSGDEVAFTFDAENVVPTLSLINDADVGGNILLQEMSWGLSNGLSISS